MSTATKTHTTCRPKQEPQQNRQPRLMIDLYASESRVREVASLSLSLILARSLCFLSLFSHFFVFFIHLGFFFRSLFVSMSIGPHGRSLTVQGALSLENTSPTPPSVSGFVTRGIFVNAHRPSFTCVCAKADRDYPEAGLEHDYPNPGRTMTVPINHKNTKPKLFRKFRIQKKSNYRSCVACVFK